MARSGWRSRGSRQRAVSRSCAHLTAPRRPTPSASAAWGASAARAWSTCSSSARGSGPACSASTSPTATGHGRIRASDKRSPSHHRGRPGAAKGRYARCRCWVACITPISVPRRASGCISSQDTAPLPAQRPHRHPGTAAHIRASTGLRGVAPGRHRVRIPARRTAGYVREAAQIPAIDWSRRASNAASDWSTLRPSVSAREKLAMTPWLRARRAVASSRR